MACFIVKSRDGKSRARSGVLTTRAGEVRTPDFMVVGTQGTVKGVFPEHLRRQGVTVLLANTYHLMNRPGAETIAALGGLHKVMDWPGPILTDSGGFQVFSLADLAKVTEEGVRFRSHVDGRELFLGPEEAIRAQTLLESDILMVFDECLPAGPDLVRTQASVDRTLRWAERARKIHPGGGRLLFGIGQGSVFPEERRRCAEALVALDFDGYAIGGVSVGEGTAAIRAVVDRSAPLFPEGKPRYLMGVGRPEDILASVAAGIDLFDCVLPTRNARTATAYTFDGKLHMRNAAHVRDTRPIEPGCDCLACGGFSRGAIRHFFLAEEALAGMLVTLHNTRFFMRLMTRIRESLAEERFTEFSKSFLSRYQPEGTPSDAATDARS